MNLARWSYRLALSLLLAVPVTAPLFFLPLTADWFQFNKLVLFYALTLAAWWAWLAYSVLAKTVRLTLSGLLPPFLALAATATASTLFYPQNNQEMWTFYTHLFTAGFGYYLLATTVVQNAAQVKKTLGLIIAGIGLAALWGILDSFSLNLFIPAGFTPAGSLLNLAGLLAVWLPPALVLALKTASGPKKIGYFLIAGLIASSLILNGSRLFSEPRLKPVLLPQTAAWSIAVDTLKTKLLLGAGPGNFSQSFNLFKPVGLNLGDRWNVNFTVSGNLYLEILTTMGALGLAALIWLILAAAKLSRRLPGTRMTASQTVLATSLAGQVVAGFFIPPTSLNWIMFFAILALFAATGKTKQTGRVKDVLLSLNAAEVVDPWSAPLPNERRTTNGSLILAWMLLIPGILGGSIFGYHLVRVYAAEYYFNQSLKAAEQNRGNDTYNLQIKAIGLMPQTDRYHLSYSNTNLALANSLAAKNDLSDQEKQTVATLIQQAIREARAAAQLQPNKAANWANLANIYKNLVNYADGADQFAQAAYVRAIQLDPANPALRLDLGGLLYSLKDYDPAVDRFKEAVALKPNYANAHYNLSYTYQAQEKWLEAYQAMQQVLNLVPADSDDAVKARNEAQTLETKLPKNAPKPETGQTEALQPPAEALPAPSGLTPITL